MTEGPAPPPPEQNPEPPPSMAGLGIWLILFTVIGLTIADFANDGKVDGQFLGALLVLAAMFVGYKADDLLRSLFERWFR